MGQRASMPQSEVAPRPRTNSDLVSSATTAAAVNRNHSHRNGVNTNTSSRTRFPHRDSTPSSYSTSSNNNSSAEEENRGEEDSAGGAELAAMLMRQLGLNSGSLHTTTSGSAPTTTGMHHHHRQQNAHHQRPGRRSEGTTNTFSLFHSRSSNQSQSGSQRLRSLRSNHGGNSTSNASAAELLANSGRLSALLQSLDAAVTASTSSTSSHAHLGTQEQQAILNRLRHSLPLLQLLGRDIKCPICHKQIPSDDVEVHCLMCLTRPVLSYNDDVLTFKKGECAICLEEMDVGDQIARLPCLCIYHKGCIDEWFKRKNTCPEHPPVED